MTKYVKRPIPIEAVRWFEVTDEIPAVTKPDDAHIEGDRAHNSFPDTRRPNCTEALAKHGKIETIEGDYTVCPGDWIITGIEGEKYPCEPNIFDRSYVEYLGADPTFVRLTEANDWEGETWTFFIPIEDNERAIDHLANKVLIHDDGWIESSHFVLDHEPIDEHDVDVLVKYANADGTHLPLFTKLSGTLPILAPSPPQFALYKGGIRLLMRP